MNHRTQLPPGVMDALLCLTLVILGTILGAIGYKVYLRYFASPTPVYCQDHSCNLQLDQV